VALFRGNEAVHGVVDSTGDPQAPVDRLDDEPVRATIATCVDPVLRARLEAIEDTRLRGFETMFHANYYPTRFAAVYSAYAERHDRTPTLDLPLRLADAPGLEHRTAPTRP
jgi:hypothetical protein